MRLQIIRKSLPLVVALGLCLCGFGQARLTTPATQNTQCVGSDCQSTGGQTPYNEQTPSSPTIPRLNAPGTTPSESGYSNGNVSPDILNTTLFRLPEYQKTEFEKYVQASIGRELPVFGREYFQDVPTTFAPLDRVPARPEYIIGPGDELLIRAWGKIDLDASVPVDRSGQIYIPRVGAINVAGIRYDQLNSYLHSAIAAYFKDFEVNATLGRLRSIQVFVLGYARRPGTYTVSSLSTLMNAVFASGGPAANGSMRHVQLKRNNTVVTDLDLYDLILRGDKAGDAQLQSGDIIYIPHVGPLVALVGSVNAPAIYELRQTTTVGTAVDDAGGLTSVAATKRVAVDRVDNRSQRNFEEFALDASGIKRPLQDGDVVRIFPVSPRIGHAVTLRGNVAQPGRYEWHEGMKVADLIPARDTLVAPEYWNTQNLMVGEDRDDQFSRVYTAKGRRAESGAATNNAAASATAIVGQTDSSQNAATPGQVTGMQSPGTQATGTQAGGMQSTQGEPPEEEEQKRTEVRHLGEINWQYAVIERMNQKTLSKQLIPFDLGKAIDEPGSSDNQSLQAGDVVTIFSQEDVPVAAENRTVFVQVEGEVKAPGVYRMEPGETLRDAVKKAGGLASHAYLYASELDRESARKKRTKRLAQMVERMQRDLLSQAANPTATTPEDQAADKDRLQQQKDLIARLAEVKPTGRVVLELKPTDSTVDDVPAIPLEDGDRFFVPARDETVQVLGSVYNESTLRYKPGKHVQQYVDNAGGATREADKGRAFVIRADGSVISKQQGGLLIGNRFDSLRLMPGDTIVVPQRFKAPTVLRELRDWSQVFAQFALGAAALKVISP